MLFELLAAVLVGGLVLWILFGRLVSGASRVSVPPEPVDPEETRRGVALLALKEIEFDRATGKLNDADYETLKARYTIEAAAALREDEAAGASDDPEAMIAARVAALRSGNASGSPVTCPRCGPRPEHDARFCSTCGLSLLPPSACARCGASLPPDGRFCPGCGLAVAA